MQLISAALPQGPQCLSDLRLHAKQLARQPRVSFAALEAALLLLRRRGMLDECEEVCTHLQQHLQQPSVQNAAGAARGLKRAFCQGLVHKWAFSSPLSYIKSLLSCLH